MQRSIEQRYAIKFCVGLGKSAMETLAMIQQVFGSESLSKAAVLRWHKCFKDGRESVEDESRSGCPSTGRNEDNVQLVHDVLNSDRQLSVQMIADHVGIDKMTVQTIITKDFQMRKISDKLVPKVLTDDQRQNRVLDCEDLLQSVQTNPEILDNVITGNETWVFEYDPETKRQSAEWHTPASPSPPKKAQMGRSKAKPMLIVFSDAKGVVYHEFVPEGQTVTGAFYVEVLKRLKGRVNRVRPGIAANWKLHHDSYICFVVNDYLDQNSISTLPPAPLQSRCVSGGLFSVPLSEDSPQMTLPPWDGSRGQSGFDMLLEGHSGKRLPGCLSSVKKSLAEMSHAQGSCFEEF